MRKREPTDQAQAMIQHKTPADESLSGSFPLPAHFYHRTAKTAGKCSRRKEKWAAPTIAGGHPSFENSRTLGVIPDALHLGKARLRCSRTPSREV